MAPRAGKGKTAQANNAVLRKRMLRVEEHLELAQFAEGEFGANAVISSYINAAIGAGDVICGALTGIQPFCRSFRSGAHARVGWRKGCREGTQHGATKQNDGELQRRRP